jgi:hypothetical protein
MKDFGLTDKQQDKAMSELYDFLLDMTKNLAREIEGIPKEVLNGMLRALVGALDYTIKGISPKSNETPDMLLLLPEFRQAVGDILKSEWKSLSYMNEDFMNDILRVVGE